MFFLIIIVGFTLALADPPAPQDHPNWNQTYESVFFGAEYKALELKIKTAKAQGASPRELRPLIEQKAFKEGQIAGQLLIEWNWFNPGRGVFASSQEGQMALRDHIDFIHSSLSHILSRLSQPEKAELPVSAFWSGFKTHYPTPTPFPRKHAERLDWFRQTVQEVKRVSCFGSLHPYQPN